LPYVEIEQPQLSVVDEVRAEGKANEGHAWRTPLIEV
jgi:hypothetical protein